MQEIPGNDLFKDVAHYFLRTPHGDIEVQADKKEQTVRCPECGQCPPLIEQWTHERATFACVTEGCHNFMYKFEAGSHKGLHLTVNEINGACGELLFSKHRIQSMIAAGAKLVDIPTDTTADTQNSYIDYCDAAEDMIRAQYECVAHNIALSIAKVIIDSMGLDPHPMLTPYLSTAHPSEDSPTKKPGVTPAGWLG